MKRLLLVLCLLPQLGLAQGRLIKVATFDSGFGGYFTAKEIEREGRAMVKTHEMQLTVTHYGDTANAPYGEKTPEQIAAFTAKGISRAFADGAEEVFIACNTASTQFEAVKKLLNQEKPGLGEKIVSIIDSSVTEMKRLIDQRLKVKSVVQVGILATPATVKAMAYPRALAQAYGLNEPTKNIKITTQKRWYSLKGPTIDSVVSVNILTLPNGKKIEIHQIGPGNWVDMIEHAAPAELQTQTVESDLKLLAPSRVFDVVGEFCTHYPVYDQLIKSHSLKAGITTVETSFIKQGPLMAGIFRRIMEKHEKQRKVPMNAQEELKTLQQLRPSIFISGQNVTETKNLSQTVFPNDPPANVKQMEF